MIQYSEASPYRISSHRRTCDIYPTLLGHPVPSPFLDGTRRMVICECGVRDRNCAAQCEDPSVCRLGFLIPLKIPMSVHVSLASNLTLRNALSPNPLETPNPPTVKLRFRDHGAEIAEGMVDVEREKLVQLTFASSAAVLLTCCASACAAFIKLHQPRRSRASGGLRPLRLMPWTASVCVSRILNITATLCEGSLQLPGPLPKHRRLISKAWASLPPTKPSAGEDSHALLGISDAFVQVWKSLPGLPYCVMLLLCFWVRPQRGDEVTLRFVGGLPRGPGPTPEYN